jgi:hypothetical protein
LSLPRVATGPEQLPRYLTSEEIRRLVDAVRTDDPIGRRVDAGTREAERCADVTNAVFGEADGAAVLAELTPPLKGVGRRK